MQSVKNALGRAIRLAGGPGALASLVGVAASTPTMWLERGNVPPRHRPGIERALHGAMSVEQFGDDVVWRRIRDRAWPHPAGRPLADYAA